jgi:hypothetical protein
LSPRRVADPRPPGTGGVFLRGVAAGPILGYVLVLSQGRGVRNYTMALALDRPEVPSQPINPHTPGRGGITCASMAPNDAAPGRLATRSIHRSLGDPPTIRDARCWAQGTVVIN